MFSIKYDDWRNTCSQIFNQKHGRKRMYLQWYPFTRLSQKEKELLISQEFFNSFIKSGLFLYYSENWIVPNNYIMKGDGNFRNASLVSPIMYLLALTIGKSISNVYVCKRPQGIKVFYAGNFDEDRLYYKKDYDVFFKTINKISQSYQYYIKTDVKDFFPNIDMNKLFDMINNRLSVIANPISQKDLLLYKELLLCLGQGEFPLIENSTVSSYLATVVYLEKPDIKLNHYVENKEKDITEFVMIRYADDLYILFNSNTPQKKLMPIVNRVINFYSSELKKLGLSLNRSKTTWRRISELNEELKKSLYDEQFNGKDFNITDIVDADLLLKFLENIENALLNYSLDVTEYTKIVNNTFFIKQTEYTPQEIFNSLVYEKHQLFNNPQIINKLLLLINFDYSFLKLDTKRFMIMFLKTKDGNLIKAMLAKLFEANRNGVWSIYDTSLAINYLLQRNFEHRDLLKILRNEEQNIHSYYNLYCKCSFFKSIKQSHQNYIRKFGKNAFYFKDDKLFFFYFMYMVELKKKNYLSAFAYFKNFFDRISAHLAFAINNDNAKGKPNYKKYYKEGAFKSLYKNIPSSDIVIRKAHTIRNANPLSHSSAELIDNNNTPKDILTSIEELSLLIKSKISEL
ncbi:AbiA family abortive infection protein [Bacillus chungangensis]|uniref:AbiA family abortive infection protein n=1 Tax=Bacillus chungangensis TaxID=587633 RepID=A0ABT9WV24_9BACI|nr:AbiA family abortive infection protein [Bacillus chungangensis]MDQ0177148.1 AbiA family abortive infection protein [Bacillus chungangensis]